MEALALCSRASEEVLLAVADGRPAAVFGVTPTNLLSGEGSPWMVGTDDMSRHARALLTDARIWIESLAERYCTLSNHVDARNVAHIRWLRRMGFTIGPAVPFGPHAMLFHPFHRTWS